MWKVAGPPAPHQGVTARPAEGAAEPSPGCQTRERIPWLLVLAAKFWGGLFCSGG